ncbi:thiamine pyrophosphate-requiring protein [Aeromicrobium duanguangcaii]|uniref:Thiamine pyrophosphate-requiring protein n=1 Tax=Aeromicrobium duanguangcaii TaxID=2968086 RepID=A0ABY5KD65_9ACTN|nr:thiamine pyrophosphate-requiring protein [Aeromicrobium duanguangcaii]MCD9154770.1 thiamine pyrophosphate-requiring protein [Aeromicrobium duanguangcaii]UUI67815.1 thiamine pyrophosphate-requiring protein [Aeromicrobium duanguangcaii]
MADDGSQSQPERLVADLVVERLRAWGVHRTFGYSGDGINGLMGALRRAGGDPAFVQARHEENAALMAVGHAKYTGGVGVMISTQGPGAVHLLNGLYDAKLDHQPVVAIVGQQPTTALGAEYQQEIDLSALFKDVAAQYVQAVLAPEQAGMVVDRAFRTALATRSPCVVILPHDVQVAPAPEEPPHEHGVVPTTPQWRPPRVIPADSDLAEAADVLNAGARVALLVGQGARDAGDLVREVAERLGAGVTTSLLGKPWWDETLPISCGVMGHLGTTASGWLMDQCDTLLMIGTNDPWTEFYPAPGQARAVQIDIDGRHLGNRYPVDVGLVGDATETLTALLPLLKERSDTAWRTDVVEQVERWHRIAEERAGTDAVPLSPERVVRALTPRLPSDAQVSVDVGSVVYWYARHLTLPPGVQAHLSSTLASMGSGLPYGLAAKLDAPDRPVVALVGDGAMQMNGIAELVTVASRWQDWADPRFVVLVLNNRDLAEVTWEQRETEGDPRYDVSQSLPDFPYAGYADLLGLTGIRVERPEDVDAAWDRALGADRPVVIEAIVDPDVPLLPPFPAGEEKLESFHRALDQEDDAEHARDLLDQQAAQETD